MADFPEVKLFDWTFINVSDALTTPEDYCNGRVSFAHIYWHLGNVQRFGKVIAQAAEVIPTGKIITGLKPTAEAMENILAGGIVGLLNDPLMAFLR